MPATVRAHAIRTWYAAGIAAAIERSVVGRVYRRLPERVRHAVYRALARRKLVGFSFIGRMKAHPRAERIDFPRRQA